MIQKCSFVSLSNMILLCTVVFVDLVRDASFRRICEFWLVAGTDPFKLDRSVLKRNMKFIVRPN